MNKIPKTIFLIAGEASGDTLGAELINSIRNQPNGKNIEFIGTGGQKMKTAGLQQLFDLTEHAVVGFWEVLKNYFKFRRLFQRLLPPLLPEYDFANVMYYFGMRKVGGNRPPSCPPSPLVLMHGVVRSSLLSRAESRKTVHRC